jgi:MFS family permease
MRGRRRKGSREVRTFGVASFFNDMGSDMIYPIWPLFVTSLTGANMFVLGLIDGIGEAVVSISKALSGWLSDWTGKRKVFIWTGYLFAVISRFGYSLSSLWWHLIPFKMLDRAGKIRGAPRDAIVADISRSEKGASFGFLRAMDNLGALIGVVITLALMQFLSLRTIFLIAAVPSVISVILIYVFIKEGKRGRVKKMSYGFIDRRFKLFLASSLFLSLSTFSYSFLLIFVKNAGYPDIALPLFYLLFTLIAALASYPAGYLSDRLGNKPMLIVSMLVYVMMLAGFITAGAGWLYFLLFILYGLFKGITETVQTSFAASLSPARMRATGIGSFQLVSGLAALPASALAGFLWTAYGSTVPFYAGAIFTMVSFGLLMFVKESKE